MQLTSPLSVITTTTISSLTGLVHDVAIAGTLDDAVKIDTRARVEPLFQTLFELEDAAGPRSHRDVEAATGALRTVLSALDDTAQSLLPDAVIQGLSQALTAVSHLQLLERA